VLLALAACEANTTPVPSTEVTPPLGCLPNRDGTITAAELPVVLDTPVDYYVSPPGVTRNVALSGTTWDLSTEYPDDVSTPVAATALSMQWYANDFPSGQFVTDGPEGLDAIYHLDDQGLWLHGLASKTSGASQTLLVYAEPVPVLRLPLAAGDAWTATGTVANGTIDGLPYIGTDTYEVSADSDGRLDLPYVDFTPALRVSTHVTVRPDAGGTTTSRRQVSFLFECFGEVARAESRADEPSADFTVAASLRRFQL
jgi:hypothetical protein